MNCHAKSATFCKRHLSKSYGILLLIRNRKQRSWIFVPSVCVFILLQEKGKGEHKPRKKKKPYGSVGVVNKWGRGWVLQIFIITRNCICI